MIIEVKVKELETLIFFREKGKSSYLLFRIYYASNALAMSFDRNTCIKIL
jgi:hypothetical protein